MNWLEAIKLMQDGKAVARACKPEWEGAYLVFTPSKAVEPSELWNSFNKSFLSDRKWVCISPYLAKVNYKFSAEISMYHPSFSDTIANDWYEVRLPEEHRHEIKVPDER